MGKTITVTDVAVNYGADRGSEHLALDGVNLTVAADEFVCIVGRSGCGKTTLLNCIEGGVHPTRGSVAIDGNVVTGPGRDRAMVFQNASLFPWSNAIGNVAYGLETQGAAKPAATAKAQALLDLVGLNGYENFYPGQLSGGMQQRVNLARALAVDPEILLLDEPFAALDAQTREDMQLELTRVWHQFNKTAVFVTHDMGEAIFLADRVIVMGPGGAIKTDLRIDLPRPRHLALKRSAEFLAYEDQIWQLLAREAPLQTNGANPAQPAAIPESKPKARPLFKAANVRHLSLSTFSVVAMVVAWQLCAQFNIVNPIFSSSPLAIVAAAVHLSNNAAFGADVWESSVEFVIGFGAAIAAGISVGILVGWYEDVAALLAPFVSGLYATPRVALAPLLITWLGIGLMSKVMLIFLSAVFPVLINTAAGIRSTDRNFIRVARSFGAKDWTIFRTVAVPGSIPYIISGLRLGSGLAIIGVVVAELVAGTSGIGHRMLLAGESFSMGEMFVCLLIFTAFGMLLSLAFGRLEKHFDAWRSSS